MPIRIHCRKKFDNRTKIRQLSTDVSKLLTCCPDRGRPRDLPTDIRLSPVRS